MVVNVNVFVYPEIHLVSIFAVKSPWQLLLMSTPSTSRFVQCIHTNFIPTTVRRLIAVHVSFQYSVSILCGSRAQQQRNNGHSVIATKNSYSASCNFVPILSAM